MCSKKRSIFGSCRQLTAYNIIPPNQRTTIHNPLYAMISSIKSLSLITLLLASGTSAFAPLSHVNTKIPSQAAGRSSTSLAGIGSVVTRVRDSITSKERSREDLKIGIAGFYDRSSQLWEDGKFKVQRSKFKVQSELCGSLAGGNDRSFIASHYASILSHVLPTV